MADEPTEKNAGDPTPDPENAVNDAQNAADAAAGDIDEAAFTTVLGVVVRSN